MLRFRFACAALALALVPVVGEAAPAAAVAPAQSPPAAAAGTPVRAMIVGDSISHGSAGDFTWRYRFYQHETVTAGVSLDLVGPSSDLYDNVASARNDDHSYADAGFDQDHDAVWGRQLGAAADDIADAVGDHQPDYLLVLLGINDLSWGAADPAGNEASLRRFIANARAAEPDIRMVFSTLLPNQRMTTDAGYAAAVADYNARLASTVAELTTAASPLILAHGDADFVAADDTWDGTHPNAAGEVKIAAAFADALAGSPAGFGTAYPRPYPSVPLGPRTAPHLSASPGDGEADLTWEPSPGATGYYVYVRNVTAGETAFRKLPYPVPGSSWTAGLLVNGATYEFQLGATKGTAEGVRSNIVAVTPTVATPVGVTDLVATAGDRQATLSWTPVDNAAGYYVWARNPGDTDFHQLPYPLPGPSWTATGLAAGGEYRYKLESVNGRIRGGMSNVATVTAGGVTPTATATLTGTNGNHASTLSWTTVDNATGYYVWAKNPGDTDFHQLPYAVTGSSWTAGLLVNGSTYQYKIQPVNGYLRGGFSNTVTVHPTGPAPAGVTDLSIEPGSSQATLTWSKVADATGYYVYVKNVTGGETDFRQLQYPVAGPSWTAGLLVSGATYQFRLQSTNDAIRGGYSNTVTVVVGGAKPAGTTLSAAARNRSAALSWTSVANATGYFVYVRDVSGGEDGFHQLPVAVGGTSWTATGLVAGGQYQFKLQSVNGYIRGGFSNTVTVTATGTTPGGTTLSVSAGNRSANLSWTAVSAATGYYVYIRDVSAGEDGFRQLPIAVGGTSWTATGLVAGGQYQFKLQSVNGLIRGGFSNTVTVTAGGTTPGGTSLHVSSGNRRANLSWSDVSSATGYYVYVRNVSAGEDGFDQLPIALGGTSWTASGLVAGAQYQFKLQSVNGYLRGGFSNTVTVTVGGATPAGPTNLTVTPGSGKATLRWTPAANATGYYVYVRGVGQSDFDALPYPVSGSSWTVSLLIPGRSYDFKLRSVNGLIDGGFSSTVTVVVSGATPGTVTDLRVSPGISTATLRWTRVANATGYFIFQRLAGSAGFRRLPYAVPGPSFTTSLLNGGKTYEFRVQAVNGDLRGGYSNTVSTTVGLDVSTLPGCAGSWHYVEGVAIGDTASFSLITPMLPPKVFSVRVHMTATPTMIVCPNGSGGELQRPFRVRYCYDVVPQFLNSDQLRGIRFNPYMYENLGGTRSVNPPAAYLPNNGGSGCVTQPIAWDTSAWLREANYPSWHVNYTADMWSSPDPSGPLYCQDGDAGYGRECWL
jgi:lysophospholipase L1-like esterase